MVGAPWCDEVVVVDSGSTDATGDIARASADVYRMEPWRGYSKQKQFGVSLARNEWVLILDGDEEVSSVLSQELGALDAKTLAALDVVAMPRRNYLLGQPVRAWWPDVQTRLIHRERAQWADEVLHDARVPGTQSRMRTLRGPLEHKRVGGGWSDYFGGQRLDARLLETAWQMHDRGKRVGFGGLWLRPRFAFFKFYVLKRGFLDGSFGLLVAQKAQVSTQLKYAALWAVQEGHAGPKTNSNVTPRA
ncbi:MAG: glycosyltransferase family 2 protein [Algisphaera sp.]